MIGEREDILNETNYGDLVMRSYDIENNKINAFYDDDNNLVFVVDNTITAKKPNVLLVINPDGDKKWDEILSMEHHVDLETIRPKQDNKYQKLDIEYSGLNVYEGLINAFVAGSDITEHLNQLNILRDSAARHSAMTRLNVANEIITKTNATIVKTKESIVRLQERLKSLRSKLSAQKKEIGKVPTKQSASKILRLESQIEATQEKIKRAKKRLTSAQRRLEVATIDAELASDLLNQPESEIVATNTPASNQALQVAPKYELATTEDDDEDEVSDEDDDDDVSDSEIKPLFDKDPEILNEDIAFKPVGFDVSNVPVQNYEEEKITEQPVEEEVEVEEPVVEEQTSEFIAPVFNQIYDTAEEEEEQKPVLETFHPIEEELIEEPTIYQPEEERPVIETLNPVIEEKPVLDTITPVTPVAETSTFETSYEPMENDNTVNNQQSENLVRPVAPNTTPVAQPVQNYTTVMEKERSKTSFIYYILLIALIALSVFTLWLYQQKMGNSKPVLTANTEEVVAAPDVNKDVKPVKQPYEVVIDDDSVFLDVETPAEQPSATVVEEPAPVVEEPVVEEPVVEQPVIEEPVVEEPVIEEPAVEEPPVVLDAVPGNIMTSGMDASSVEEVIAEEPQIEEPVVDKPAYDVAGNDDVFVSEDPEPVVEEPVEEAESDYMPDFSTNDTSYNDEGEYIGDMYFED